MESLIRDKDYFLCHRIDKETSGLMIVAKSLEIANIIKDMFENRAIVKKYIQSLIVVVERVRSEIRTRTNSLED